MSMWKYGLSVGVVLLTLAVAVAQEKLPPPMAPPAPAPVIPPNTPVAVVNGQTIYEVSVQRGLLRVPPIEHERARPEILNQLVENTLIDQHLANVTKVVVTPQEVDARMAEIRAELKKNNQDFDKLLVSMSISEGEMKSHVQADLRWEKHTSQGTEAVLKQKYEQNIEFFDGTQVRARHILFTVPGAKVTAEQARSAIAPAEAQSRIKQLRDYLESVGSAEVAKLPSSADPLTREETRLKAVEVAFGKMAAEHSVCSSKKEGGELGWFPRSGAMVEPFAKAAFALKPGQLSQAVESPFGYHLILLTARKPGMPTKFEDVKEAVFEWYCAQVRAQLLAEAWPTAKVTYPK